MRPIEFQVLRQGREARWAVMVGNSLDGGNALYGVYLDREQAVLDAVDAARCAARRLRGPGLD
jgi:hypothetical protein